MYSIENSRLSRLRYRHLLNHISWVRFTIILLLCLMLSLMTSIWGNFGFPSTAKTTAHAASPLVRRINIPYFNGAPVPFNQTAIFWFGQISSGDNSIDVRMGYNNSELYVDLHIVDRYLWYDPNAKAPDLTKGDTTTVYLNTTQNGGGSPDQYSYKFVAQVDWYQPRTYYQQAFKGNGSTWVVAPLKFTSVSGWRGTGFNGNEDAGYTMTYHIPFSSLGRSGPPSQGTPWKLGLKVHNQDNPSDQPLSIKWWPETASDTVPASWGALVFGLPTYQPPKTSHNATYTVQSGFNNQVVTDGMVGGSLNCFTHGLNRWTNYGSQSYPGQAHINIQNEVDESDWDCFSKFYISFPLNSFPKGKGVVSAKVTLYEWGNPGPLGKPNPSLIQVASVNEGWNPATLSWNNAPLIQENISRTVVNIMPGKIDYPGVPYSWDVSKALAAAYAAGQPLRLVFYSSDSAYSSGKYFFSSSEASFNAKGRPLLQATLGNPTASSSSSATLSTSSSLLNGSAVVGGQKLEVLYAPGKVEAITAAKGNGQPPYVLPLLILPAPLFFLAWMFRRKRLSQVARNRVTHPLFFLAWMFRRKRLLLKAR